MANIKITEVSPIRLPKDGGTITLHYTIDNIAQMSVTAYSSMEWLTAEVDKENQTVTVRYQMNSENLRDAEVVVKGVSMETGSFLYDKAIIQQAGQDDTAVLILDEESVTTDGRQKLISVGFTTKNVKYLTTAENSQWLTAEIGYDTIDIFVDLNSGTSRTAIVNVSAYNYNDEIAVSKNITITQTEDVGTLFFEPSSIEGGYKEENGTIYVNWNDIQITSVAVNPIVPWFNYRTPSPTDFQKESGRVGISYTLSPNEGQTPRTTVVVVGYTNKIGQSKFAYLPVNQEGEPETIEFPIWKDTDIMIDCGDSDLVYYNIQDRDSNLIYSGRSYAIDGFATIRVNDILKDYLTNELNLDYTFLQSHDCYKEFYMSTSFIQNYFGKGTMGIVLRTYYDYSYNENNTSPLLSDSPRKSVDYRQLFMFTYFNKITDESQDVALESNDNRTLYSHRFNNEYSTYVYPVANFETSGYFTLYDEANPDGIQYKIECHGDYCLYYHNKRGGWCWLNCDGKVLESDKLSISTFKKNINNTTKAHNLVQYRKGITKKWNLNSGLLTSGQSEKVVDLFSSPVVYLHNLKDDTIMPVNITDTNVEYKSYKNRGKKLVTYTINVELAQDRFIQI